MVYSNNGSGAIIVILSLSFICLTKFLHFLFVPLKVNFGGAPLLFVVKPTAAGATAIQEKCKERGQFLDPDSSGKGT